MSLPSETIYLATPSANLSSLSDYVEGRPPVRFDGRYYMCYICITPTVLLAFAKAISTRQDQAVEIVSFWSRKQRVETILRIPGGDCVVGRLLVSCPYYMRGRACREMRENAKRILGLAINRNVSSFSLFREGLNSLANPGGGIIGTPIAAAIYRFLREEKSNNAASLALLKERFDYVGGLLPEILTIVNLYLVRFLSISTMEIPK